MAVPLKSPPSPGPQALGELPMPYRCQDTRTQQLWGLRGRAGAETLILKGGPHRHPRDLHADPMASPWPALGLLSITCCSCSRCVPGRINSRPGRAGGGGGGAESSGRPGTVPGTARPLPLRAACASGRATCCCFLAASRLPSLTHVLALGLAAPWCGPSMRTPTLPRVLFS